MGFFDRLFGASAPEQKPDDAPPDFPYPLIRARGGDAVKQCLDWREEWRGSFTPIILGTPKDFRFITELWPEMKSSPTDFLQYSLAVDVPAWFHARVEEFGPLTELTNAAAWNSTGAQNGFQTTSDILTGKIHPWVWAAKMPTSLPYEVPAYLRWGGWNACPSPEEHVAVWRYWQEKYGAEILCVTGDVIEATVARPPTEKDECYSLALEQFGYCDDIVTQGVGSIDALAATLRDSKCWYFWWD